MGELHCIQNISGLHIEAADILHSAGGPCLVDWGSESTAGGIASFGGIL